MSEPEPRNDPPVGNWLDPRTDYGRSDGAWHRLTEGYGAFVVALCGEQLSCGYLTTQGRPTAEVCRFCDQRLEAPE